MGMGGSGDGYCQAGFGRRYPGGLEVKEKLLEVL